MARVPSTTAARRCARPDAWDIGGQPKRLILTPPSHGDGDLSAMTDDPSTRAPRRAGRWAVAAAVAVVAVVAAGAVAWAGDGNGADGSTDPGPGVGGARPAPHRHGDAGHAAYEERYAAAPETDQQAADDLVAEVRATLAAFPTPAGTRRPPATRPRAPGRAPGGVRHYLDRDAARDGAVLDPSRPEGLVYYTVGGQTPVLLGAVFVAPAGRRGAHARRPTSSTWHSHDPGVPRGSSPRPPTRAPPAARMLHVWTVEHDHRAPGSTGRSVDVRVTDPFGAPFFASVVRA